MFPKRYAECKVDGNEVLCHSDRVLLAMSEYESELASLRQKQVLWEAGNRELADRLEARDVAIDALRAEKERAEAERDEAIRMRDRHAEASKAQNEDITALLAERDAALYESRRNRAMFDAAIQQLVKIQSFVKGKDIVLPDGRRFSFHPPVELVREAWTALTEAIESTNPNIDAAIAARKGEQ